MGRYAVVLAMPLILGFLIASTVLLINELRERSQRRRRALREARRLDSLEYAMFSAGPTSDDKDRRIPS